MRIQFEYALRKWLRARNTLKLFLFLRNLMHTKKLIFSMIFISALIKHTVAIAATMQVQMDAHKKLQRGAAIGNLSMVQEAFAQGADQNAMFQLDNPSSTPLFLTPVDTLNLFVKWSQHEEDYQKNKDECREIIREFFKRKANFNMLDSLGNSIIMKLAVLGEVELVRSIIDRHPTLQDTTNHDGHNTLLCIAKNYIVPQSSMYEAHKKKKEAMYHFLITEKKFDVNHQNKDGTTALYIELLNDSRSSADYLIKLGAQINQKDCTGNTILSKLFRREIQNGRSHVSIGYLQRFFELGGNPWGMKLPEGPLESPLQEEKRELILFARRRKCALFMGGKLQQLQWHGVYPYLCMNYPNERSKRLQRTAAGYNELERQKKQNLQKLSQGHLKKPRMIKRKAVLPYKDHSLVTLPGSNEQVAVEDVD